MIIGFFGDLGSGKTLTMTKYAYAHHLQGYKIYSNYSLSFPHTKIDAEFLERIVKQDIRFVGETFFALDEFDMYLDSRLSAKKRNIVITYFIKQIRKKDIKLAYATQMEHTIDKRLRILTRTHVLCDKNEIYLKPSKDSEEYYVFNIITNHIYINRNKVATKRFLANKYYGLYDTKELIKYEEEDEGKG